MHTNFYKATGILILNYSIVKYESYHINYKDDANEEAMQPLNHHKPQTTLQKWKAV